MRPIWYFVGLLLSIYGVIVAGGEIIFTLNPPEHPTAMAHLRPGLWWGGMMVIAGVIFLFANRRKAKAREVTPP